METTKTEIVIVDYKDTSANRTTFETRDHGKMSAFKNEGSTLIADLKDHINKLISVDVSKTEKEGNTYYNIRNFNGVVDTIAQTKPYFPSEDRKTLEITKKPETNGHKHMNLRKEYDKDPVGLAVEMCTGLKCSMQDACEAVKYAQEQFS